MSREAPVQFWKGLEVRLLGLLNYGKREAPWDRGAVIIYIRPRLIKQHRWRSRRSSRRWITLVFAGLFQPHTHHSSGAASH
jgi:hypothetical protein